MMITHLRELREILTHQIMRLYSNTTYHQSVECLPGSLNVKTCKMVALALLTKHKNDERDKSISS